MYQVNRVSAVRGIVLFLVFAVLVAAGSVFNEYRVKGQTGEDAAKSDRNDLAPAAAVSFDGSTYTQDFQTMTTTNATSSTQGQNLMVEVTSLPGATGITGWYLYGIAGNGARWLGSNGGSSTGSFYGMFDSQTVPNRALGSQGSGNVEGAFGVVLQNTSGATINTATVSYDAVMNRNPATTANPYPFSYRVSGTAPVTTSSTGAGTFNDGAGSWLTNGTLSFVTPSSGTGAPGAQNAISPLFRIGGTARTSTLTNLSWGNNQYLYIRWRETDDGGADATAGVDNFSIVAAGGGAAPTITENTASTRISLNATGAGNLSGTVGDSTDPGSVLGADFVLADSDTLPAGLSVTATSSNTTVVPTANLSLTGSGLARNLKITPAATGYSNITVTVSDGTLTSSYVINYAASVQQNGNASTRWHTGKADASTVVAVDADYMLVADDEDQTIRLYERNNSGAPVASFDYTTALNLTDISGGVPREVDIEASARVGNTIYWLASHSNSSEGNLRANRSRLFSTTIGGSGASTTLTFNGYYANLKANLIAWDSGNVHGLGADFFGLSAAAASGKIPESADGSGWNIEGLVFAPDDQTAYISFRAPIVPAANRTRALIVPVTNITQLVGGNPGAGPAVFGTPIQLNLGGRGIREIKKNSNQEYLIIGGSATSGGNFAMYAWTGNPGDPALLRTATLTGLNPEGIVDVPLGLNSLSPLAAVDVQLISDQGDTVFYGDGTIAKDLPATEHKKSRTDVVTVGLIPAAANVRIDGRVLTSAGRGLSRANLTLTDTQTGAVLTARTSSLGYFQFEEVLAGQSYVLNVAAKQYDFQPMLVTANDDITALEITAQP